MLKANWLNWQHLADRMFSFFLGEYFTDALRNTLVIVLPIALLFINGYHQAAIGIGLGALLISLTDLPGNRTDKLKTAILSNITFLLTALIISFSLGNPWFTATALFLLTCLFSMFSIYGTRFAFTGTMAIILSTFTLGLHPESPLQFSGYVFLGGSWYYLVSLVQISLWPYKYLHHAIFECLLSTSRFLKAKAKCYDGNIPLRECYQETIALHMKVSEKQDLIRNLLLNDKYAMNPSNIDGKRLLMVAEQTIALYEQVTAIHYDYNMVRTVLLPHGSLPVITKLITLLAEALKMLSRDFLRPTNNKRQLRSNPEFKDLLADLKNISKMQDKIAPGMITKIVRNIEDIETQINDINITRTAPHQISVLAKPIGDYQAFLSPKSFGFIFLKQQFSLNSLAFRFSLRLALSFLVAYLLTLLFPSEKYSYWMLLTIVIVARPRYGLTWKRNKERLWGTLGGVIIGYFFLTMIPDTTLLLILSVLFLFFYFIFNRSIYSASVMCITPAVMICLSLYHGHMNDILSERIYYTLGGCIIAFAGLYLFPIWESNQLKVLINEIIQTNINFMEEVRKQKQVATKFSHNAGVARKNAHIALARFSEALQLIQSEPAKKKIDIKAMETIQELNYRINAVITSLYLSDEPDHVDESNVDLFNKILNDMKGSISLCLSKELPDIETDWNQTTPIYTSESSEIPQLDLLAVLAKKLKVSFEQH